MKWIGLTGGIASGKSTVSRLLREQGFTVIDADSIAKYVVEPGHNGLKQVVNHFGAEILKPDGSLDRRKLGQMVFGSPAKLLELENLLHPLIKAETLRRRNESAQKGEAFAFYDVPLLFEKKMESEFDSIIVVEAGEHLQKSRMKQRDQLSDDEIIHRLRSQIPLAHKVGKATWVLRNEGTLEDLELAVRDLVRKIQSGIA
jgi:dephospho-CoA kinase